MDETAVIKQQRYKEVYGDNATEAQAVVEEWEKADFEAWKQKVKSQAIVLERREKLISKYPKFWLTAMTNFQSFASAMMAEDREALEHLTDLRLTHREDPREFDIVFTFAENPFFSNTTLTKSYTLVPDPSLGMNPAPPPPPKYSINAEVFTSPVKIDWKDDSKNLTKKYPRADIESLEEFDEIPDNFAGSFFHFFEEAEDSREFGELINTIYSEALDLFAGVYDDGDDDEGEIHSEDEEEEDDADKEIDLDEEEEKRSKKRQRRN